MSRYTFLKRGILFKRLLALALSSLLHPLFMPTYLFLIILKIHPMIANPLSSEGRVYLLWMIFFSTFLFPFLTIFIFSGMMKNQLKFSQLIMERREDRIIPFLLTGMIYLAVTYLMFHTLKMNGIVVMIMAGISLTVVLVALITMFWKISAHSAGISGIIALLFFLNQHFAEGEFYEIIIVLIVLAGVLSSARLYLNSHNPLQIFGGILLGISTAVFSYYVLI